MNRRRREAGVKAGQAIRRHAALTRVLRVCAAQSGQLSGLRWTGDLQQACSVQSLVGTG
jgi:hypothetical protein